MVYDLYGSIMLLADCLADKSKKNGMEIFSLVVLQDLLLL